MTVYYFSLRSKQKALWKLVKNIIYYYQNLITCILYLCMGPDNTLKYILCLNQNETEKEGLIPFGHCSTL